MRKHSLAICVLLCFATGALAHQGVKNAAVKARMDAMSAIGKDMKVLGGMAKGEAPFDEKVAQMAVSSIADHAAKTFELFEANETDPKSEAKPAIWGDFGTPYPAPPRRPPASPHPRPPAHPPTDGGRRRRGGGGERGSGRRGSVGKRC